MYTYGGVSVSKDLQGSDFGATFASETTERLNKIDVAKYLIAGRSVKEVARLTKLPVDLIEAWQDRDADFKQIQNQLLDGALDEAKSTLARGAVLAAAALISALNSTSDAAKVRAAVEVLNRVGMPSVEKHEVSNTARYNSMSDEELMRVLNEKMRLVDGAIGGE